MEKLESLRASLTAGTIDRREFLRRSTAAGIGVAAMAMLTREAAAATPKKGGTLRMGLAGGNTNDSLDPGTLADTFAMNISQQTRNKLTEIAPDGELVGELAESFEGSNGAKVWTFELRKGIEFHNGKTLDAEDVIYSINHHRGPDTSSAATGMTDPIADLKADGKHTVVFTLTGGNADFAFGMSDYHFPIVPAGTKGTDWQKSIGTGAFTLDSFDPGVKTVTKRNPNYWKEGRGHFDEVESININDVSARTNAMKTGQIHVMNRCDMKTVHLLEQDADITVHNVPGMKHITMPMHTDKHPFSNNEVRLALKHAIDREHLVKTIVRGYGQPGNDHPVASIQRYHHGDDIAIRQYDPDRAKYHLKRANVGNKFSLQVSDAAFQGAVDMAVLFKEHAAKCGIEIELIRAPADGYWSDVWLVEPWCVSFWSGRPTEDWIFSLGYAAGANWNASNWDNERFNQLLILGRAELDQQKRREIYVEMQRLCRDDGGHIIPMFLNHIFAVHPSVTTGPQVAGNFELDGNMNAERWWFSS